MTRQELPAELRLSSWRTTHYRWMLPLGFLGAFGVWIAFVDLSQGEWEEGAVLFGVMFLVTLWGWNRVSQEVEVWLHGDHVRMRGRAGTVELGLNEIKRVRIMEEREREHRIDRLFLPAWSRRWGRAYDRIEVELEDMTVLGKRVVFRLERSFESKRRNRDPRFVRWMGAVNRQNSRLDKLGPAEDQKSAPSSMVDTAASEVGDPIKRLRRLRRNNDRK